MRIPRPAARQRDASLGSNEDFQRVYRTGTRHSSGVAAVYVLPHEGAGVRLGIPAGRKLGDAVSRNRLRRRIREAFRNIRPDIIGGADIVIVPRGQAMRTSFGRLVQELTDSLVRAGLIQAGKGSHRPTDGAPPHP